MYMMKYYKIVIICLNISEYTKLYNTVGLNYMGATYI